jgi:histidinol phosphatase-like enzyme
MRASPARRLRSTVHRHTREGAWKPDASVLLEILRDVGADPRRAVYVGDSLVKSEGLREADGFAELLACMDFRGFALRRPA